MINKRKELSKNNNEINETTNELLYIIATIAFLTFFFGVGSINQMQELNRFKPSMLQMIICIGSLLLARIFNPQEPITLVLNGLWVLPIAVMVFSGMMASHLVIDHIIYLVIALFFMMSIAEKLTIHIKFMRWMLGISLIFCTTVYIEGVMPDLIESGIQSHFLGDLRAALRILNRSGYRSGATIQPLYAATYISVGLGYMIAVMDEKGGSKKKIILALLLLVAVIQTGKRMAFLGVIVSGVAVYFFSYKQANKRVATILKIILMIFVAYVVLSLMARIFENASGLTRIFNSINEMMSGNNILSQRNDLWSMALKMFEKSPIYGAGWGAVSRSTVGLTPTAESLSAHNSYIQLLAETGLVGTLLYLLPFVVSYMRTVGQLIEYGGIEKEKVETERNILEYRCLKFAVFFQTFFFVYGLTENPVNEPHIIALFFVTVAFCSHKNNKDYFFSIL